MKRLLLFLTCVLTLFGVGRAENKADFPTMGEKENTSYSTYTSTNGWKAVNSQLRMINNETAPTLNGKTTAVGVLTSPTLNDGIGSLSFKYQNTYSEKNGVSLRIEVKQNGSVVYTESLTNKNVTQNTEYSFTSNPINKVGDFIIEITNLSPSNNSSNADRVSIYELTWTNYSNSEEGDTKTNVTLSFAGNGSETVDLSAGTFKSPTLTVNPVAASNEVEYSSSDESVATVNNSGLVTLLKAGTTKIIAEIPSKSTNYNATSAEYTLTVTDNSQGGIITEEVTQNWTNGIGLLEKSDDALKTPAQYTATNTSITYTIMGCYTNSGYLFVNGKTYSGAYVSWSLDYPISQLKLTTSGGGSTNANNKVNIYADGVKISDGLAVNVQNNTYTIEIPAQYQKAGVVFKVESATTSYNAQFSSFTYVKIVNNQESQVSTPSIICEDNFVTITCETDNAEIYYTTDGSQPSNSSTKYTDKFEINPDITVVKAIAYLDNTPSAVSSLNVSYTYPPFDGFESFISTLGENKEGTVNGPITVIYQNGQYLYVEDNKKYPMLIYGKQDNSLSKGNKIGSLKGSYTVYNDLPEFEKSILNNITSEIDEIEPTVSTLDGLNDKILNSYVRIENIIVDNMKLSDGSNYIDLYGRFSDVSIPSDNSKKYNVEGFTAKYNGKLQIYPIKFEEVKSLDLGDITVKVSDGQTLENDGSITIELGTSFTFTAENATEWEIIASNDDESETEKNGSIFIWTPTEICEDIEVGIYAFDNNDAEKEFIFHLTVTPIELGDIEVIISDGQKLSNEGEITVEQGTTFTFTAKNATHISLISDSNDCPAIEGNTLVWTVDNLCENEDILVSADIMGQNPGKYFDFTLTVIEPVQKTGNVYTLVTSPDEITSGYDYIFVAYDGTNYQAMSTEDSGNKFKNTQVEKNEEGFIIVNEEPVLVMNAEVSSGDPLSVVWKSGDKYLLGQNNGTNLQLSNTSTASTVSIDNSNGNATIKYPISNTTDRMILYTNNSSVSTPVFGHYASSNAPKNNTSSYFYPAIYRKKSAPKEYRNFEHEFPTETLTIAVDETYDLFETGEEYPSTLNFDIENPDVVSISAAGEIKGLKVGESDVTVSWTQDDVNYFNASGEPITFHVLVNQDLEATFDFTVENAYGMTVYSGTSGEYEKKIPTMASEEDIVLEIGGQFRAWSSSSGYELRVYGKNNGNGYLTFTAPEGCRILSMDFEGKTLSFTPSEGDFNQNTWTAPNGGSSSVNFKATDNPYITTITVFYEGTPVPVNTNVTTGEKAWNSEWSKDGNDLTLAIFKKEDNSDISKIIENFVTFEFEPTFSIDSYEDDEAETFADTDSSEDKGYTPVTIYDYDGEKYLLNANYQCSGTYDVYVKTINKSHYNFDGEERVKVGTANIYPSIKGLELDPGEEFRNAYKDNDEIDKFGPFKMVDDKLSYNFIRVDENVIHEASARPIVVLPSEGVTVYYWYDGIDEVMKADNDKKSVKLLADTDSNSTGLENYYQADEENRINIGGMLNSSSAAPVLHLVLSKNGATTPFESNNAGSDVQPSRNKIEVTLYDNVTVGVGEIIYEGNGEVEYYDLNGVKINAERLEKGIYIKVENGKASKVVL